MFEVDSHKTFRGYSQNNSIIARKTLWKQKTGSCIFEKLGESEKVNSAY